MIKLIIFDYDGVLFDTKKIAFSLIKKMCEKHCRFKVRNEHDFAEIYKSNFYESMRKKGASREAIEKIKSESLAILSKKRLQIHNGVKALARKLSKTHTLAVISSNYDIVMRKNLKRNGILGNFKFILGTEEGESKSKKIKMLLESAKASKSEALFITDTVGDVKEAKKAGIKSMAVTWGFHKKAMLKRAKPDFIADKAGMIQEVLA